MDDAHEPSVQIDEVLRRPVIQRLRMLLAERSDVLVSIGDMDGRMLWGSVAGSENLFHRLPEDYYGHSRFEYIHPGDVGHVRRMFAQAVAGETVQYTFRGRTAEGEWQLGTSLTWRADGVSGSVMVTITVPATTRQDVLTDLVQRVPPEPIIDESAVHGSPEIDR